MLVTEDGTDGRGLAPVLEVRALGQLSVCAGGRVLELPPGRPRELVGLLASMGGAAPVDVVVEHLWADCPPGVGRTRLRNVIARIRAAIPGLIRRDGGDMALLAAEVDVERFTALARDAFLMGDLDAARAAVAVYGGELLPTHPYAPWAWHARDRFCRLYVELLELLRADAVDRQDLEASVRWIDLAMDVEPLEDHWPLQAARLLSAHGRTARAARYVRVAKRIAHELGVEPSIDLRRLELQVGVAR